MIKLFLIFLLPLTLFGAKILSYNIYDRTDRVDVMITFDTPYDGVIKQSNNQSKIIIKLEDASIESSKIKKISSKFIKTLTITPLSSYTQIVASVPSSTIVKASKTSDAYGLRLRFTNKAASANSNVKNANTNSLSSLPTKQDGDMQSSYYIVIAILIIGIVILLILKKRMSGTPPSKKQTSSWLFKETQEKSTPQETPPATQTPFTNDVSIRFQRSIDAKNNVVMLDFADQSYLVLMGNSNILLDKFTDNKPATQEDFDTILRNRHQELDDFLQVESSEYTAPNNPKEALQAYKERASSISYEV